MAFGLLDQNLGTQPRRCSACAFATSKGSVRYFSSGFNLSNITVTQDGLGVTRGIELGVGSPHQVFSFRPATTLNNTRINNVLNCGSASNDSCIGSLGGGFDTTKSKTYTLSIKSQWNGSATDQESSTSSYVYFNDNVGFQSQGDVNGYPLVMESQEFAGKSRICFDRIIV